MKKLLSLLLCVFLLTATLAACGKDTESKNKENEEHDPDTVIVESQGAHEDSPTNATPSTDHYGDDGHDHGTVIVESQSAHEDSPTGAATPTDMVRYQVYTNTDQTYQLVFRDADGKVVAEFDQIAMHPSQEPIDAANGVYELGWASGSGANDYYCVYYNVKTGAVSQAFHAPRGCDGVRVAYGSEDQTKVIVQDVFDQDGYYKEHVLEGAYTKAETIILGGKLQADKKTVVISYVVDEKGEQHHVGISLYD